jgi:hypothetical protein
MCESDIEWARKGFNIYCIASYSTLIWSILDCLLAASESTQDVQQEGKIY